ncbi:MAG TPA: glycosyltransferase family 4 protein [Pirellulales bacterium]|nr:glycosyltransferase family 4 protein [Pirellulales bacterium]
MHGGERSLLATLPVLRQHDIEPVALAPSEGPLASELARTGVPLLSFEVAERGRRLPRDVLRASLPEQLAGLRPALLHANSLSMGRLSGPVAQRAGVPSIAHLRDIIGLSAAAVADLNCHTRLLAVSQATRSFHVEQGVAEVRTHVCYNGVDLDTFRPRPPTGWLHRRLGLPGDAVLVATIGQLVMRKGHDVLVRAATKIKDRLPAIHWLVIGERHSQKAEAVAYEAALHAAIGAAGLSGRFHFLGTLENVADALPELALLVHPARQEPLGRVLLEAAAAGVAIIATDVGGTREIFPDPSLARLVLADDDEALATAMVELIESPLEREKMSLAGRRRMEEQFDIKRAAEALVEHYRAVASSSEHSG